MKKIKQGEKTMEEHTEGIQLVKKKPFHIKQPVNEVADRCLLRHKPQHPLTTQCNDLHNTMIYEKKF